MFTPEQLVAFASAGWSPDAIKEMLAYDTEVQKALEKGDDIKPEDVGSHIEEPQPKNEEDENKRVSANDILENILGGN